MRLQSSELAVKSYETALDLSPTDEDLVIKIGNALISTHNIERAKEHYENAIQMIPRSIRINVDLATLYINIKDFDKAIQILKGVFDSNNWNKNDLNNSKKLQILSMIGKVYNLTGQHGNESKVLLESKKIILSKNLTIEGIRILHALASNAEKQGNLDASEKFIREALEIEEDDENTLALLSGLLFRKGSLDESYSHCEKLLHTFPNNTDGVIVMGDLLIAKSQFDDVINCYKRFLQKNPNTYCILIKYVWMMKRVDKMNDATSMLKIALSSSTDDKVINCAGFNMAKVIILRLDKSFSFNFIYFS